jgi:hypothetical protein
VSFWGTCVLLLTCRGSPGNVWVLTGLCDASFQISAARRLMVGYRIRLDDAGRGPYHGGSTPSSGYVALYVMLQLCDQVTVYGSYPLALPVGLREEIDLRTTMDGFGDDPRSHPSSSPNNYKIVPINSTP